MNWLYRERWDILGVCEDRTSLVQQIVNTELDASLDDPSKRTVMMIGDVVDQERIIESQRLVRNWR